MSLMSPQLQAFLAVAQKGTVHQAANLLLITQTGVTQRIKSLESQLGLALFERSRKGMRLTSEGEALLRYCQRVLEIEGETLAALEGEGKTSGSIKERVIQRLSITGPSSMMRSRVIPSCSPLVTRFPQLRFTFEIEDSVELGLSKLRAGQTQLAIIPSHLAPKELDRKVLKAESFALYVPEAWKKRTVDDIIANESIVDFSESDQFTFDFIRQISAIEPIGGDRHFANNTDALASMIGAGLGYSVLAEDFASAVSSQFKLEKLKLKQKLLVDFSLVWYMRPELPAYFRTVVEAIP